MEEEEDTRRVRESACLRTTDTACLLIPKYHFDNSFDGWIGRALDAAGVAKEHIETRAGLRGEAVPSLSLTSARPQRLPDEDERE